MNVVAWFLFSGAVVLVAYTYAFYPAILWLWSRIRPESAPRAQITEWPSVSISLPVYNEVAQIRDLLESILTLDYPVDRRQVLVISDASNDGTDEIVREYASRGVELLRMSSRVGKTAAENAGAAHLRGEIIINTDASVRIQPPALKAIVAVFRDPTIGVASGRDVSVAPTSARNRSIGEAGYVGYEMQVRHMETRVGGIIGASGCFYGVLPELHRKPLPTHLSRDFASALIARENGYRAVSVDDAVCVVPRTGSLRREYSRKVRTMSRGMETLLYFRKLLNPWPHGRFAWMLFSHKVCRWLVPLSGAAALIGLLLLASDFGWARVMVALYFLVAGGAALGWWWPEQRRLPRLLGLLSSVAVAQLATLHAMMRAAHGDQNAAWEPTRRELIISGG